MNPKEITLQSPLLFQGGVVCNQITERPEKVMGKAAKREMEGKK